MGDAPPSGPIAGKLREFLYMHHRRTSVKKRRSTNGPLLELFEDRLPPGSTLGGLLGVAQSWAYFSAMDECSANTIEQAGLLVDTSAAGELPAVLPVAAAPEAVCIAEVRLEDPAPILEQGELAREG